MRSPSRAHIRSSVVAIVMSMASAAFGAPTDDFFVAQELFEEYRYADGLVPLRRAADAGDLRARRILGMMLLHGEALYGVEVPANREEGLHWLRLAAGAGCQLSRSVLSKLERATS